MRKIVLNKKFLVIAGLCLTAAGALLLKNRTSTQASDSSFQINGLSISVQQCEGKSQEIMEEDIDETISNEVMALEEQGHDYEIGDAIETKETSFIPMTKEIDNEKAYHAFGGITSKSGKNYVIVVKSEGELTQDDLESVVETVKEQIK